LLIKGLVDRHYLNIVICNYQPSYSSTNYQQATPSWIMSNTSINSSYVLNEPLIESVVGGIKNLDDTIKWKYTNVSGESSNR